jgi:hypothetical protein
MLKSATKANAPIVIGSDALRLKAMPKSKHTNTPHVSTTEYFDTNEDEEANRPTVDACLYVSIDMIFPLSDFCCTF